MDKDASRQWPLSGELTFEFGDTTNGASDTDVVQDIKIEVPEGARIVGGEIVVETAWVGPTAANVDIGDTISPTRYGTNVDLKVAARTALVLTGFKYTAADTVQLRLTQTVAVATVGKAYLRVEYVREGRGNELQT